MTKKLEGIKQNHMGTVRAIAPTDDILDWLKKTKDPLELSDIIQSIDKFKTATLVSPYIPTLLKNRSWILRADVLELIGRANFKHYKNRILAILKNDPNIQVKSYALLVYYDLFGKDSISVIKRYVNHKSIGLRKTALCLLYVATKKKEYLDNLDRIVSRKNTWHPYRYAIYKTLVHYLKLKKHPELILLFEKILASRPELEEIKVAIDQMKTRRK